MEGVDITAKVCWFYQTVFFANMEVNVRDTMSMKPVKKENVIKINAENAILKNANTSETTIIASLELIAVSVTVKHLKRMSLKLL